MFLNIITPCSRPENLDVISKSINIPRDQYRWIVVFDLLEAPANIPDNCEWYSIKDVNSMSGNAQRNFALNLVTHGHIYFNDDDTIMQPNLWDEIKDEDSVDFISFKQAEKNGSVRLEGLNVSIGTIDSHNFVVSTECMGDTRWVLNRYDADGVFARECFEKAKTILHISKILSVYNSLK
tara:strand:- start:250 stop:789 length:540 start_codon:yes stop_codon:yes gene_type:complete